MERLDLGNYTREGLPKSSSSKSSSLQVPDLPLQLPHSSSFTGPDALASFLRWPASLPAMVDSRFSFQLQLPLLGWPPQGLELEAVIFDDVACLAGKPTNSMLGPTPDCPPGPLQAL